MMHDESDFDALSQYIDLHIEVHGVSPDGAEIVAFLESYFDDRAAAMEELQLLLAAMEELQLLLAAMEELELLLPLVEESQ